MATRRERNVGLSLAGAGIGIIGVAFVFGLTTAGGGPDWVGVITAIAGLVMISTGLLRAFRKGRPHTA
jgi:drug/metabolite transporter (DMT)-like permease